VVLFLADAYKLPQGVFLFLGYSETDEALLKPHSNLSIQDAVSSLQDFMRHEFSNKVLTRTSPIALLP
jgi:hypothetical protein